VSVVAKAVVEPVLTELHGVSGVVMTAPVVREAWIRDRVVVVQGHKTELKSLKIMLFAYFTQNWLLEVKYFSEFAQCTLARVKSNLKN